MGTTTLGRRLADRLGCPHVESDALQWLPTDPPYQRQRPVPERLALLAAAIAPPAWVLSGSVTGWGGPERGWADRVVYLDAPTPVRMARLRARDAARFGPAIEPGGPMYASHQAFLAWAEGYERGDRPGRSRDRHMRWLDTCVIPALHLDGTLSVEALLAAVEADLPLPR